MTNKEEIKIGKHTITFFPDSHRYKIDGSYIPSVTTILNVIDKSRPLLIWAEGLSRESLTENIGRKLTPEIIETAVTKYNNVKKEACDNGTMVHDYIESYIHSVVNDTDIPDYNNFSNEVSNGIMAFFEWEAKHKVKYIETERIIYSGKYNYVGTLDCVAEIDGKLTLLDFKTGKAIYNNFWLQLSAYSYAYAEETKVKFDNYAILHLNKDTGIPEYHEKKNVMDLFPYFEACIQLNKFTKLRLDN